MEKDPGTVIRIDSGAKPWIPTSRVGKGFYDRAHDPPLVSGDRPREVELWVGPFLADGSQLILQGGREKDRQDESFYSWAPWLNPD